tara:strand:- start:1223 stop:2266 length:1044 start_codon:yes stop_codon:yes gene_type:complete
MKIVFYSDTENLNTGSYRIWVHDLNTTLVETGIDSKVVHYNLELIDKDADVVIFCKSAYKRIQEFKKTSSRTVIGAINVSCDYYDPNIDFVIAGSPEEYASLSRYKNVFIYPLIEKKFENIKRKEHTLDRDVLTIGFHGHYPHLFKFEPFLKNAIEGYDKNIKKVELNIITGNPGFEWKTGRPDVKINIFNYDENFSKVISSCDVGVVPNVSDIRMSFPKIQEIKSIEFGLYDTDYYLRLKNKTNAGRAYVFYQHGIPVIHDLSPSSFELMKITGYNICAHDSNGWYRELCNLTDYKKREEISKAYYAAFDKYYNLKDCSKKLINSIENVKYLKSLLVRKRGKNVQD